MSTRRETASQTAGPYVHIGLAPQAAGFDIFQNNFGSVLANERTKGQKIRIEGRVFDGIGTVLKDVLIEIWQANAEGKYAHPADRQPGKSIDPAFRGWGRGCTDFESGVYSFDTVKPGSVPDPDGRPQAPHIVLAVFGRGMLMHLYTRIYLGGEAANAADPVLALVPIERRATLIAQRAHCNPIAVYRFDIHLQGDDETVFFDV